MSGTRVGQPLDRMVTPRKLLTSLCTIAALLAGSLVATVTAPPPAAAITKLDRPPKSANDWSCRPTAAHPRPVVLVHGLGANMGMNWSYLAPKLKARGYCVFALTYGLHRLAAPCGAPGGTIPIQDSARELAAFIDRVLRETGAAEVDLVGHSEGTFMPQYYLKFLGGAPEVKRGPAATSRVPTTTCSRTSAPSTSPSTWRWPSTRSPPRSPSTRSTRRTASPSPADAIPPGTSARRPRGDRCRPAGSRGTRT